MEIWATMERAGSPRRRLDGIVRIKQPHLDRSKLSTYESPIMTVRAWQEAARRAAAVIERNFRMIVGVAVLRAVVPGFESRW